MKKPNKPFILGISAIFLILIFSSFFLIDIGINSNFFIKKNFNKAFKYRSTGDCASFINYVYQDHEDWYNRCQAEKSHNKEPIRDFKIQRISHELFSNRAFLQVDLKRNLDTKENYEYSVNYEMKRDAFQWLIDQEIE